MNGIAADMEGEVRTDLSGDVDGRSCVMVSRPCREGLRTWRLLATRGPRTLLALSGTERADLCREAAIGALAAAGRFGLAEDEATRGVLRDMGLAGMAGDHGPTDRRGLAALMDVCGAATACVAAGRATGRDLAALDAMAGAPAVDRLAESHPFLVPVLRDLRVRGDARLATAVLGDGTPRGMAAGLAALAASPRAAPEWEGPDGGWRPARAAGRTGFACAPRGIEAFLRRCRGLGVPGLDAHATLALAGVVPVPWMPGDEDALAAFGEVASLAASMREASDGILDIGTLVSSSRGRWPAFLSSCARAGLGTTGTPRGRSQGCVALATDMAREFERQVALPALACDHASRLSDLGNREVSLAADDLAARLSLRDEGPAAGRAWRVLFGGKGLVAVISATSDWKSRRPAMRRTIRTTSDSRRWGEPFRPRTYGDATLVALTSAADLAEEGESLSHCVGTFGDACACGLSVIVSVRRPDGVGGNVPTSTAELTGPGRRTSRWRPRLVQHKGRLNMPPSGDDVLALGRLLASLDGVVVNPRLESVLTPIRRAMTARAPFPKAAAPPRDDLGEAAGYDWRNEAMVLAAVSTWSPYAPRAWRGAGLAGVVDGLGGPEAVLGGLPAPPSPRRRGAVMGWRWPLAALALAAGGTTAFVVSDGGAARRTDDVLVARLAGTLASSPTPCPGEGRCGRFKAFVVRERRWGLDVALDGGEETVLRVETDAGRPARMTWPRGEQWHEALASAAGS